MIQKLNVRDALNVRVQMDQNITDPKQWTRVGGEMPVCERRSAQWKAKTLAGERGRSAAVVLTVDPVLPASEASDGKDHIFCGGVEVVMDIVTRPNKDVQPPSYQALTEGYVRKGI